MKSSPSVRMGSATMLAFQIRSGHGLETFSCRHHSAQDCHSECVGSSGHSAVDRKYECPAQAASIFC